MLFLIQLSHFVQMTFERAASYKFVQYGLIDPGHRGGKKAALLFIPLQQRRRQHHKAYADRRRYGLGKCTDINHLSRRIRCLQGRHRLAPVTEFTVVIILNQIPVRRPRSPFQKLHPPADRHHHAGGILMGGHTVGYICSGKSQLLHGNPVFIHRDGHHPGCKGRENTIGSPVGGIFKGHTDIPAQNVLQKKQKIIVSRTHDNLLRGCIHPS